MKLFVFCYLLSALKYIEISNVVGCSDFVIFVSYDKQKFGGEIRNFLSKICDEAKKSDLSSCGWKVHHSVTEETKNQDCYMFTDRFNICFTAE